MIEQPNRLSGLSCSCRVPVESVPGPLSAILCSGWIYGFFAMLCFAVTPVATRAAVTGGISPFFVGSGRAFGAALLAAPMLLFTRQPWPGRKHLGRLLIVMAGLTVGFPLLTAWALQYVPAAHVAVIFGLLPLATAVAATLRAGERPSVIFWSSAVLGSALVVAFSWHQGDGHLQPADWALFLAVLLTAFSYADGAVLARTLGGWQVISWALTLASPITGAVTLLTLTARHQAVWHTLVSGTVPTSALLGFAYVTVCSQWLAFFAWYRALTLGGVARISQLQLLMPFATIIASALLLGEPLRGATVVTALAVAATVAVGRQAAIIQQRRTQIL